MSLNIVIETSNKEILLKNESNLIDYLANKSRRIDIKQDSISFGSNEDFLLTGVVFIIHASLAGVIGNASWDYIKMLVMESIKIHKTKVKYYVQTIDQNGNVIREKIIVNTDKDEVTIQLANNNKIVIK